MQRILAEYFAGTGLENVKFNWQELLRSSDISNLASHFISSRNNDSLRLSAEVFQQLVRNAGANFIPLVIDAVKFLASAGIQIHRFTAEQNRRLEKEIRLRKWVLEIATSNSNLKKSISTDPKLIAISYKIDVGEQVPWLYAATHSFNNRFGVNWSPLAVFSFVTSGLFGIAFLGYWFLA